MAPRTLFAGCLLLSGCAEGSVTLARRNLPFLAPPEDTGTTAPEKEDDTGVEEIPEVEDPGVPPDPSDLLFSDQKVGDDIPHFKLTLSDADIDSLYNDPYTWVHGGFSYDGLEYGDVGIRLKGENSFQSIYGKSSFKVKFDKYVEDQEFYGLQEITLNNMVSDYSMLHERVAYRLYREAGVPAARAHHATVSVNGEPYGLYAHVETVDKTMIRRWFNDADGSLFEVWDVDFYDWYIRDFELEYGEDDRTALQGVADSLEATGAPAIEAVQEHLDLEQFLLYWAVGAYIGQFDAYPYSSPGDDCHVYDDPESEQLHFLPHGMDECLYYPSNDIRSVYGIIATRCEDVPTCKAAWKAKVWEVADLAEEIDLAHYAQFVASQISDLVLDDPRKPYSDYYVDYYQQVAITFLQEREAALEDFLGPRP